MSGVIELDVISLYNQYQAAVKSSNVEDILKSGKLYYRLVHNGELTKQDREQLQKDVFTVWCKQNA